jgi:hypothetical protein
MTKTIVTRKFSIKKLLNGMSRGAATDARTEMASKLGVSYHWFVCLTNAVVGSDTTLSSSQLLIISDYFDVSVDTILTPFQEESRML